MIARKTLWKGLVASESRVESGDGHPPIRYSLKIHLSRKRNGLIPVVFEQLHQPLNLPLLFRREVFLLPFLLQTFDGIDPRSEERRVGEEGRTRWWSHQ